MCCVCVCVPVPDMMADRFSMNSDHFIKWSRPQTSNDEKNSVTSKWRKEINDLKTRERLWDIEGKKVYIESIDLGSLWVYYS